VTRRIKNTLGLLGLVAYTAHHCVLRRPRSVPFAPALMAIAPLAALPRFFLSFSRVDKTVTRNRQLIASCMLQVVRSPNGWTDWRFRDS